MKEKFRKQLRTFKEVLRSKAHIFDSENIKNLFEEQFSNAKKLSDFIAMIVRLAFVQFAVNYFIIAAKEATEFYKFVYLICSITAFIISVVIFMRIVTVIFLYYLHGLGEIKSILGKILLFASTVFWAIIYYLGIFHLVRDLAEALLERNTMS